MRAAVRHEYGTPEVLQVEDVPTPTPGDDDLLIRVYAASVNLGDWELLTGQPAYIIVLSNLFAPRPRLRIASPPGASGRRAPKYRVLGTDLAGRVEAVGQRVTEFRPGDEVFGDCGIVGFGAFAEYVCVPRKATLVPKPAGMSFEQAAAIPQACFIALQGLRDKARVRAGQKVLINGAGGGAGTFAVQIAKSYGAEVTAVDGPGKQELMRSLGADHLIDYTREDYTRSGQRYDVVLDMAGYRSIFESRRSLTPNGRYLLAGGSGRAMWQSALLGPLLSIAGRRASLLLVEPRRENLAQMVEWFEAGTVVPVIDQVYPLDESGDAIRRVGERRSLGKVIVTP